METKEIMCEKIKNEIRDNAVHGSKEASGSFNLLFEFLYEDIIKISKRTISSFSKCKIDFEDLAHETFLSVYRKIIVFISNNAEFQYVNALGYIKKTAVNIVLKKIKNSDNLSIDDIPEGVTACAEETYDKLPLNNLIISSALASSFTRVGINITYPHLLANGISLLTYSFAFS